MSIGIVYRLRAGRPRKGVRYLAKENSFSLLKNIQTDYGAHPAASSVGAGENQLRRESY